MRLAHPLRRLFRPSAAELARQRAAAITVYRQALLRKDTRAQHAAERPAITATSAQLAAEIGWKGAR